MANDVEGLVCLFSNLSDLEEGLEAVEQELMTLFVLHGGISDNTSMCRYI